jgi:LysR family transcriptional activator of nhaA
MNISMEWMNYHHLLYFWVIAREGSVTRAGQVLNLSQPTLSNQIRSLEESLGERLFTKVGRHLELTETGKVVYRYAEEIFTLGQELQGTLKGHPGGRQLRFAVGVSDALSKLMIHRLLEPALALEQPIRFLFREDKTSRLLADLMTYQLDLVLTDAPMGSQSRIKAFNHLLGECDVSFFGTEALADQHRERFPKCLNGAPMLLPSEGTTIRRSLDGWMEAQNLKPIVADSALMKSFGQASMGFFAAPSVIAKELMRQYEVRHIGKAEGLKEGRIKHPAVLAISQAARSTMFG